MQITFAMNVFNCAISGKNFHANIWMALVEIIDIWHQPKTGKRGCDIDNQQLLIGIGLN